MLILSVLKQSFQFVYILVSKTIIYLTKSFEKMKFEFNLNKLFVALVVAGSALTFSACSNDDDVPAIDQETETLLASVEGIYTGVATSDNETEEVEESEAPAVKATVTANTIKLEALQEVIAAAQNREASEEEQEIAFELEYTRSINAEKNEVIVTLASTTIEYTQEEEVEGETVTNNYKIVFEGAENGIYNIESSKLNFNVTIAEATVNEEAIEGVAGTTMSFDLTKINK